MVLDEIRLQDHFSQLGLKNVLQGGNPPVNRGHRASEPAALSISYASFVPIKKRYQMFCGIINFKSRFLKC